MTEEVFRGTDQTRKELGEILSHPTFRAAFAIIINKRRVLERSFELTNLDGEERQSLRLFNQRIGMESVLIDLYELTTPQTKPPQEPQSTFGQEEAFMQLQELQDNMNQ